MAADDEGRLDYSSVAQAGLISPPVRLRSCTEADVPKLMRFIHQHWHPDHVLSRDETLLRWQYHPSRAESASFTGLTVMLADMDGEIVGMLGVMPFDFNIHGVSRPGAWVSQWLCVPELRRYRIGRALMWQVYNLKYEALLGMGVSPAGARATAAVGFQPIPVIPRWLGVFDPTHAQQLFQAVAPLGQPRELAQALLPYVIDRRSSAQGQRSIRIMPWADSLRGPWDRLWMRSLAPSLLCAARDSSYLLWRYIQHPRFRYQFRVAQAPETGEILGLSVFRVEVIQGHRAKAMRIVEFLALPQAQAALAGALIEAAREQDVTFADFYCTCPAAGAALESVGFRRQIREDVAFSIPNRLQPLEPDDSPLSGVEWLTEDLRQHLGSLATRTDVYMTRSDSDQDRPN